MRRLLCASLTVSIAVLIASFFRPMAFDLQLTHGAWIQVACAGGGVRLIAVHGDPTRSSPAAEVIEREKNTWRNVVTSARWGGFTHYSGTADTLGTPIETYRLDAPLLFALLLILLGVLMKRALRRWCPPPRLLWNELRTRPAGRHRFLAGLRRACVLASGLCAWAAAALWAGTYLAHPEWLTYTSSDLAAEIREHTSLARFTGVEGDTAELQAKGTELKKRLAEERRRPFRHFVTSANRGHVEIHLYSALDSSGRRQPLAHHSFGGFRYDNEFAVMLRLAFLAPSVILPSTSPFVPPSPLIARERSVWVPFWSLVILFSVWPVSALLRGPWRRARRLAMGCCRCCGYNLTGLAQPRCPECGREVELPNTLVPFEHGETPAQPC